MKKIMLLIVFMINCIINLNSQQIFYAKKNIRISIDTPHVRFINYDSYFTNFIETNIQILIIDTIDENFSFKKNKIGEWKIDTNKFVNDLKKGRYESFFKDSNNLYFKDCTEFIQYEFGSIVHQLKEKDFTSGLKFINTLSSIEGQIFKLDEKEYFLVDEKNLQKQYYIYKDTFYSLKPISKKLRFNTFYSLSSYGIKLFTSIKSINSDSNTLNKFNFDNYKIIYKMKLETMDKKEYDKLLKPNTSYWDLIY